MKHFLLLMSLIACSCSDFEDGLVQPANPPKEPDLMQTRTEAALAASETTVITNDPVMTLGATLNNPYTVGNMQAAYNRLPAATRALAPEYRVSATHRYYKFPCIDSTRLDLTTQFASDNDLALYDYPFLEREMAQEGIYRDPTRSGDQPNPLYAVLPVSLTPPAELQAILVQHICGVDEDLYDAGPSSSSKWKISRSTSAVLPNSSGNSRNLSDRNSRHK